MDSSFENDPFDRLEQELAARPRSDAPVELRARVMKAVGKKLLDEQRRGAWMFVASVAAVFVLWCNLSWFAARHTQVLGSQGTSSASLREMADQIQELVPELSRREAGRQALLLQGRIDLKGRPVLRAPIFTVH